MQAGTTGNPGEMKMLPDAAAKRREIYRLHDWLLARGLTGLITAKAGGDDASSSSLQQFGFMQFMVDCAVILNHSVVLGVSQRNLRVQKYRGSSFDENESPFLIGKSGIEVAVARTPGRPGAALPSGSPDEELEMVAIDDCGADNPARLDAAQVAGLEQGGASDGMRYLYPYDGTVFPRGLAAPMLMWEGPPAEAVLVRIRSKFFQYDGCLLPKNGRVLLPKEVWERAGAQTLGARTPFTLELTTLAQGKARGPIREQLVIARARVQGSIYYNTTTRARSRP